MGKYQRSNTIQKLYPIAITVDRMLTLMEVYPVTGRHIHDLFLAATMLSHGVTRVYTYDPQHFVRIEGIEVLTPESPTSKKPSQK